MKKPMMKLQARHPPQKKGVVLMVITPDRASDGISTNPNSKITPIDFAATGCFPKRYLQWRNACSGWQSQAAPQQTRQ
jgi:hypothetical protein